MILHGVSADLGGENCFRMRNVATYFILKKKKTVFTQGKTSNCEKNFDLCFLIIRFDGRISVVIIEFVLFFSFNESSLQRAIALLI